MTKEMKMKALEMLQDEQATVVMNPSINGGICTEFLGLTEASHRAIDTLIDCGYSVSLRNGMILVNYFQK